MRVEISKEKGALAFFSLQKLQKKILLSLSVSPKINPNNLQVADTTGNLPEVRESEKELNVIHMGSKAWKITCNGNNGWRNWWITFSPKALIFPTREGEFISNPKKLPCYRSYNLSYPGTASTKCIVVLINKQSGFLVGAKPSLNWARLTLTRNSKERLIFRLLQKENELYIIPFSYNWKSAVRKFSKLVFTKRKKVVHKILAKPRFFLQIGVRDFFGNTPLHHFSDLLPIIRLYRETVGKGHFIHLFATNALGFDRMLPDFSIDPELGGEKGLSELVDKIHNLGLYTSHHFNPRIAEIHWVDKQPKYKRAVVTISKGKPWLEFYKNNIYYVMDPNCRAWRKYCLKTILYFKELGFDYIQLDQIAYQRNLITPKGGFGPGYQKLINETSKTGIKFWIEGVTDIYQIPEDCFFQVLQRGRIELWDTEENRRGYPYGKPFAYFYRNLMPDAPISLQIFSEQSRMQFAKKGKADSVSKTLALAKKLGARIYDLEIGLIDETYEIRLKKTLEAIKKSLPK